MKFIKYAVGLVIALSVIPLVVVTVSNLDAPRLKTIEFEVVDFDSEEDLVTFSDNTYNNLYTLAIFGDDNYATNLIIVKLNGIEMIGGSISFSDSNSDVVYIFSEDDALYGWVSLDDTNTAEVAGYNPTLGDKWEMTFEVPRPLPPLIKLLVGFVPLLFIGGVLIFMLNKRKLD